MSHYAVTATKHYSRAKGSARCLQLLIADALNDNSDLALRDARLLAEEANTAVQVVRRLILAQIAAGELIGMMSTKGGGAWYKFAIPIYPGEEGYDPQPCEGADHICNGHHTPVEISRERLYRDKAREARQRDQPPRMKRTRKRVHSVDNSDSYQQAGTQEFHAPGTQEFHTGTQEFHTGTQEFHTGTQEFHSLEPSIGIPISYPVSYPDRDPSLAPEKNKLTRAERERLRHADEEDQDRRWRERAARDPRFHEWLARRGGQS